MSKADATLNIRVPSSVLQELNTEAGQSPTGVLSDYVRGIIAKRNEVSKPIPGQEDLEKKLQDTQARLEKANRELDSLGFKKY